MPGFYLMLGIMIYNHYQLSYASLRPESDTLSASGVWLGLWGTQFPASVPVPRQKLRFLGVWCSHMGHGICPLLLLRPGVHGVKVLVVFIITVTRGQPRPVFLSFQGSQDPKMDKEGWGYLYWCPDWVSLLWEMFLFPLFFGVYYWQNSLIPSKGRKKFQNLNPWLVGENKYFVWLLNMYRTYFTVIKKISENFKG